jgi:hypothetical protein
MRSGGVVVKMGDFARWGMVVERRAERRKGAWRGGGGGGCLLYVLCYVCIVAIPL